MSDTTPPPNVWPTLRARDARTLIRFLVDVVGFEETAVHGDGDVVHHAELSWPPGGGIMLGSTRDDGAAVTGPGQFSAYVVTDEPDALCARVRAGGADRDRVAGNAVPEGNHWYFGTYRGAPRAS